MISEEIIKFYVTPDKNDPVVDLANNENSNTAYEKEPELFQNLTFFSNETESVEKSLNISNAKPLAKPYEFIESEKLKIENQVESKSQNQEELLEEKQAHEASKSDDLANVDKNTVENNNSNASESLHNEEIYNNKTSTEVQDKEPAESIYPHPKNLAYAKILRALQQTRLENLAEKFNQKNESVNPEEINSDELNSSTVKPPEVIAIPLEDDLQIVDAILPSEVVSIQQIVEPVEANKQEGNSFDNKTVNHTGNITQIVENKLKAQPLEAHSENDTKPLIDKTTLKTTKKKKVAVRFDSDGDSIHEYDDYSEEIPAKKGCQKQFSDEVAVVKPKVKIVNSNSEPLIVRPQEGETGDETEEAEDDNEDIHESDISDGIPVVTVALGDILAEYYKKLHGKSSEYSDEDKSKQIIIKEIQHNIIDDDSKFREL